MNPAVEAEAAPEFADNFIVTLVVEQLTNTLVVALTYVGGTAFAHLFGPVRVAEVAARNADEVSRPRSVVSVGGSITFSRDRRSSSTSWFKVKMSPRQVMAGELPH